MFEHNEMNIIHEQGTMYKASTSLVAENLQDFAFAPVHEFCQDPEKTGSSENDIP